MLKLGGSPAILFACCIGFLWAQSSRAIIYAAMPAAGAELGLSAADIGVITGALYAGYALAVFLSGFIPLDRRLAVAGGFVLTAAGNVAFAGAHALGMLLLLAALSGAGVGLYLPRGTAAIVEAFGPETLARAMGWHEVAATGGLMLAPLFMGAVLLVAPWRMGVALWSIVGVLAAVAVWQLVPNPPRVPGSGRSRLALDWRVLALGSIGGSCFAIMAGFFTMMPTIAVTGWGFGPAGAASLAGWMRASGLVGSLLGGWLADRIGRVPGLLTWFLVALVGVVGLAVMDFGIVFAALIVVITNAACAGATAYYALLGDAYHPGERERTFSLIAATASVIGSVATPVLLGLVLSATTARMTMAVLIAGPLIGLAGLGAYVRLAAGRDPRGHGA